jgi:hypothetical protein
MAEGKFFSVTFKFVTPRPAEEILEAAFNSGLDWFKYAPNCWIIWTTSDAEKWYERLRPIIQEKDSLFIVAIRVEERQGWMSAKFWEWLRKER